MLAQLCVEMVKLFGGSYEAPAIMGASRDERTPAREAYFLECAKYAAAIATMPLMVTGEIERRSVDQTVIDRGVGMAGIATAITIQPDLPNC